MMHLKGSTWLTYRNKLLICLLSVHYLLLQSNYFTFYNRKVQNNGDLFCKVRKKSEICEIIYENVSINKVKSMKKISTLFYVLAVLFAFSISAQAGTWTYTWNKKKPQGGQGFYNLSDTEQTTQKADINGIEWTLQSDTYATGFTDKGQQIGTTKNPLSHGVMSTTGFNGKNILKVSVTAYTKKTGRVTLGVKVNNKEYGSVSTLTTTEATYVFVPAEGTKETGTLELILDQDAEDAGMIMFNSITVEYEGDDDDPVVPVVLLSPELNFAVKEVSMYVDDNENPVNNPLTNPFNVSPITYTSSDKTIAIPDQNGDVYSVGSEGEAIIYAIFAGNDEYRRDTASYTIKMVPKPVTPDPVDNTPLKADFTSDMSKTSYYKMGWDSMDEAGLWKYYGINESSWTLSAAPYNQGVKPFTVFDPLSKYSLSIIASETTQAERAVSPSISVLPNSEVEFYACFHGVWVIDGKWKLNIYDMGNNQQKETLVDGFNWAQETGFVGPNWVKFNADLSKYAGHECAFEFTYEGINGDNMSIDGFTLNQMSESSEAKINVVVGQKVQFKSTGEGTPESYEWTFEGADVTTSTEAEPVVTYSTPGEYSVTLVVRKGEEESKVVREKVVIVKEQAPTALIGSIEGAYSSPWVMAFVPTNVPVKFTNESLGHPTEYNWTFDGTDVLTSKEATPTVIYTKQGKYGAKLTVSNVAGSSNDEVINAIQAGGSQDVWNVKAEELNGIDMISHSFFGYYGGTNWLGMKSFAERFHKPLVPASVDSVTVYFGCVSTDTPDSLITVSLCFPDEKGMPGKAVVSKSLKISELKYADNDILGTDFAFGESVDINSDFFITVSGFPNSGSNDLVMMFAVRREPGSFNSTFHYLEDEDENYKPLGTYTWYENVDEAASFLVTAHLTYKDATTDAIVAPCSEAGSKAIYSIDGRRVKEAGKSGIYVIREGNDVRKIAVK